MGARASRPQSRACARRSPILAFPRKGGRDPLASVWAWFRQTYPCKPMKGEGIRNLLMLDFGRRA